VRKLLVIVTLAAVVGACSDGGGSADPEGDSTVLACAVSEAAAGPQTLEVDGQQREYVVHLPDDYDGSEPAPLVLNLHGFGGTIDDQDEITDLPSQGNARGYVVVTPQGLPISIPSGAPGGEQAENFEGMAFWNFFGSSGVEFGEGVTVPGLDTSQLGVDDVAFFSALLDRLERDLCIDPERMYSTGMSNGAGMTTTLGCELGERFDAIAPVSGVNLTGSCPGDTPVPVRAIHGDADDVAAYDGNSLMGFELGNPSVPERMVAWAEHNGCRPDPEVVEDGSVTVLTWDDCTDGATVQLFTIHGWGHQWPRASAPSEPGALDATAVVFDFFDDQSGQ
jgi:polyhydroxybutyrate depolymerase